MSHQADGLLAVRDSKPIEDRVTVSVAQTKALRVTDAESYKRAGEHLTGYGALVKEIEAYFQDDKSRAYALWQSQCKKEKAALTTVQAESTRLRGERQIWKAQQDALQRQAEQQAALAAKREEEERSRAWAYASRRRGATASSCIKTRRTSRSSRAPWRSRTTRFGLA